MLHQRAGWEVIFIYREANMVARGLAKLACNMQNEHVQIEESLGQVCSDIFTDKQCINPVRCIQQQLLLLKKGGKKYMSDCKVNGA